MDLSSWKHAVLAFTFPVAALADVSGTVTLQANTSLSLDATGAKGSANGSVNDLLWTGSSLNPQGKATAFNIGVLGPSGFAIETEAVLKGFRILASAAPIPSNKLPVDEVFVVYTNAGNVAKLLVAANSGGSITLQYTTFITPVPTGPTITQVLNNSSRILAGLPNSGIAPSSLFVIIGTGLADAGVPVLQSSEGAGLQTTLNGASITVTVNGTPTHPALYYTSPTQLGAVLPAATPVGTGTITVTFRGVTSSAVTIQVVASAPGISTYNGSGIATDAVTGALLTYISSGTPGETIILWGTGLGADPADSDTTYTATPHTVNVSLQVYIGGIQANIVYQGASVYPGVDVIGLTIPPSVPSGCWISVATVAGSVLSNVVTLPINRTGGACLDPQTGLSGNQISPGGGQTLRTGLVALGQSNSPAKGGTRTISSYADAAFEKYTGIYSPNNSVSPGGCIVNDLTPVPVGTITGLDPGVITLTGPSGSPLTLVSQLGIKGAFYVLLPAGTIPQSGGTFTFKGTGGADVGAFTSTITFANPLLTWTNQSVAATIDRSQGFTVTWTGGNPGTYVFILGTSATSSGLVGGFTCLASVDDGQFKVPSYILSALPAGNGGVQLQNNLYLPLPASGLDIGLALGGVTFSVASVYK